MLSAALAVALGLAATEPPADPAADPAAPPPTDPVPAEPAEPAAPLPAEPAAPLPADPPDAASPDAPAAPARRRPDVRFKATGHAKGFFLLSIPREIDPFPSQPATQGVLDGRLALSLDVGRVFRLEAAHAITTFVGATGALGAFSTGVGQLAPEAVELHWEAFGEDRAPLVRGRTDRLVATLKLPHVDIGIGRQPISFGSGRLFTPLDLVNPFTPATVDTEVKPGVDAVRIDAYAGMATRFTAVAAYAGAWSADGIAVAAHGQTTVGTTDLALMYGFIRGDHVVGASVVGGAGPVGIHGDVAVTVPPDDATPFVRAVVGADGRPTGTTTLTGELYLQTLGTTDPGEALRRLTTDPRYARGELWLVGIAYYGLGVAQEIVPTLNASLGVIGSLTEPSALITPSVVWSVADNADLVAGGFVGLGKKPELTGAVSLDPLDLLAPRSEFGTYGSTLFVQLRAYF